MCACPKSITGFPTLYVVVFYMTFIGQRSEVFLRFVDFDGIACFAFIRSKILNIFMVKIIFY
jgi:hypothetical protein